MQGRHRAQQGAGHERDAEREHEDVRVETEIGLHRNREREVPRGQRVEQPDGEPGARAAG